MDITDFEKGWLKICGVLAAVIAVFFVIRPSLSSHSGQGEPLADAATLQELIAGQTIPQPAENAKPAVFHEIQVTPPTLASLVGSTSPIHNVLGEQSPEDKHIEVDLANQRVYAFEGTTKVYDFPTSTGKWGRTPTGEFTIWVKMKSVLMSGGSGATYYYLPNVPYTMFFSGPNAGASMGYSLHGTYWHDNFGHPMSHGCVNLRTEDAKTLFNWVTPVVTDPKVWSISATKENPGTKILIYGTPPDEVLN